jgi:hypothetical protein
MSLKQKLEKLEKQANADKDRLGIVNGIGRDPEEVEKEVQALHAEGVRTIIILDR